MREFRLILVAAIFQHGRSTELDATVRTVTNFVVRRHVQTVTVNTCRLRDDMNGKLLESLSSVDVSVSFRPFAHQAHDAWYRHAFLVDLACKKPAKVFQQVSDDRLFNTRNDWILLRRDAATNGTNAASVARKLFDTYLGDAYVLPDSAVYLLQRADDGAWEIWTGFRASVSDAIRVYRVGSASPDVNGLDEGRRRFRGITLKANTVIVDREQFVGFGAKISSDLDIFSHMHYVMVDTLSRQLDFKIALGVDAEYGWSFGNGSFGGLIGALQRNEIDLSATGVLMRTDRMAAIDYTICTIPFRTAVLFRQPRLSSVRNILLLPFSFELWLTVLATLLTFVCVLVLFTLANNRPNGKSESPATVHDILILVLGAVCQQSASCKSKLESIRIVIFVLFLTSVFVFTSYSASIAALIQLNSNLIKSVRDVVELPMTFSAQISPYGKYYFEETEDPLIKTLYKTKMIATKNDGFSKAADGIAKIRTEFHGFMSEVISAYKIIGNEWRDEEKCRLAEIQLFRMPPLSIPVVKNSGHRELFKQMLIQQMEVGLAKRIVDQWVTPKPTCGASSRSSVYVGVSITEIRITLKIFGCGVCISLGILAMEVAHHYWTDRRNSGGQRTRTKR